MAEVHRKAFKLGLTCSINNFHLLLCNQIYCGRIRIREIEGEQELIVKGLHELLITEKLFNKVQKALKGDIKLKRIAIATPKYLPLRGFLKCPCCHRSLRAVNQKAEELMLPIIIVNRPAKSDLMRIE